MKTKFKDLMGEVKAEAKADGPEAVKDLRQLHESFKKTRLTMSQKKILDTCLDHDPKRKSKFLPKPGRMTKDFETLEKLGFLKGSWSLQMTTVKDKRTIESVKVYRVTVTGAKALP